MLRKKSDAAQVTLYSETFQLLSSLTVDDSEFSWAVQELRDLAAEKATGEVITEAMEILRQGKTLNTGETIKGHEDARSHLIESFADIDRELTMQEAPEGDMRAERTDILKDYADRKHAREQGTSGGILFGIAELDNKIGGLQNGELILSAGYSSDGKTSLCVQMAWSAAVEQGKNVVFLTTETLRPQVRRKLVARHSKLPIFEIPDGLNTRDLKAGTLTAHLETKLQEVVTDLTKNPSYGQMYIAQVPRNASISSIESRLYRIQRKFHIDLVICDYLALLKSDRTRQTAREELSSIIKEAKQLATTFDDGRGIPFVSPWQVNRAARDNAETLGYYTSASLAETSEATNSADVIISILAPTDNTNRHAEIKGQILKSRDGETSNSILMDVDYATSTFVSRSGMQFASTFSGGSTSGGSGLDSLID
jgi:replicative DNA helicase